MPNCIRLKNWARMAAALCAGALSALTIGAAAADHPYGANYFPNVALTTQDGKTVKFYDELLKGGGWNHPIHIHFEEGQVLERNGKASNVPAWEKGRKDVYRLRPGGSIKITMQFRDWGGMFMEHCHNTVHEDNAMLLRWEINDSGAPFLKPLPTPIPSPQGVTFRNPTEVLPRA